MVFAFPLLLQIAVSALVIGAAVMDLRARLIPNWLTLSIALGAPLFWLASGLPLWPDMTIHLLLALGCFLIGALAFAASMMGGGDVKMIGAVALWLPALLLGRMLVLMALIGGVLGLIYWLADKIAPRGTAIQVPYGVAIAAATLCVLWEPNINPFG